MEKERSMEEYCVPPALQEFPQLKQLSCVSLQNHHVIVAYLAYLRARHYGHAMQEGTIRALKSFVGLLPEARQTTLGRSAQRYVKFHRGC